VPSNPFSISVLIPTLNSERTLGLCLGAVREQNYPHEAIEIIVADGGSSDSTLALAREYGANVVTNDLRTGEAGKAVAFRAAKGDLVCFLDSDNVLIGPDWLTHVVAPFYADSEIVGAEPLRFIAEKKDTIIDRYCAAIGANDPLCLFIGNYDKYSILTGQWTSLSLPIDDHDGYFTFPLSADILPTIGANGTVYRRKALENIVGDYFMDIDIPYAIRAKNSQAKFAKIKIGIRHLFCSSASAFARKQKRRVRDFLSASAGHGVREYPWRSVSRMGVVKFSLATLLVVPLLAQAFGGFIRGRDWAVFFHPIACWITLAVYGSAVEEAVDAARYGVRVVIVNPGVLYGPRSMRHTFGHTMLELAGGKIPGHPAGGISLTDVNDAAAGILSALERGRSGERYLLTGHNISYEDSFHIQAKASGTTYVGRPLPTSLLRAAAFAFELTSRYTQREPRLTQDNAKIAPLKMWYDATKAQNELGYHIRPLEATMQRMVEAYRRVGALQE